MDLKELLECFILVALLSALSGFIFRIWWLKTPLTWLFSSAILISLLLDISLPKRIIDCKCTGNYFLYFLLPFVVFIDYHKHHRIRYQSDKLCKENNLVVIDEYYEKYKKKYKTKGKSYKEYQERKKASSWKGRLQFDIDRAIKKAKDWDDFLNLMKQYGYEIKYGKHISFKKIDGQQRFTRAMRIGEDYTEKRLKERILEEVGMKSKRTKAPFKPLENVIDISANDKVESSPGYKYWATKHNLSTMADTINQVRSEGFKTREQLEKALYEKAAEVQNLLTENKEIEKLIELKKKIMENRYIIEQYKEIYKY